MIYLYFCVKILNQDEKINIFKLPEKNQEKPKEADQAKLAMEDIDIKRSEDLINLR